MERMAVSAKGKPMPGAMNKGPGARAERAVAAILYVELRNFTRLSEMLDPEKVLNLASSFFSLAAGAVESHGGQVFSLQNDTLVAAFRGGGATQCAAEALDAAQAALEGFEPIAERWKTEYGLPATLAAGVHLGDTIFGMTGPQSAEQYVAFGDTVSIAERLVHRARNGEIVISIDVMKALGPAVQSLGAQELPSLELSGRDPLPIYGMVLETRLDFT